MNIAVQISDITDVNRQDAVEFIQAHLIMKPKSILKALSIENFYFYSRSFDDIDWNTFTASFTATPTDIVEDFYINSSGNKIQVPYGIDGQNNPLYRRLKAGDHILSSDIANNIDVKKQISFLIEERFLYLFLLAGDFNDDFNNDFL